MRKTNKIKLITLTIIALMITMFATTANAATLSDVTDVEGKDAKALGDTVKLGYTNISGKTNTYCIQHHKILRSQKLNYKVDKYVYIDGKTAKVYTTSNKNGKETEASNYNAIMAYLFYQKQGYGSANNYTEAQKAIWHFECDWTNALFGKGNYYYWAPNKNIGLNNIGKKAKAYAKSVGNLTSESESDKNKEMKDTTPNPQALKKLELGDNDYLIGPFSWEFSGNLKSIDVIADGSKVSNVKFAKYKGTTATNIDVKNIESGDKFYVRMSNAESITSIHLDLKTEAVKGTVYTAKVWFFRNTQPYTYSNGRKDQYQNLMHVIPGKKEVPGKDQTGANDYTVQQTPIKIGIIKVDDYMNRKYGQKIEQGTPLENVGFKFKTQVLSYDYVRSIDHYTECTHIGPNGQKLHDKDYDWTENIYQWAEHTWYVDNTNKFSDVGEDGAHIFYTDSSGMINASGITFATTHVTNRWKGDTGADIPAKYKTEKQVTAIEVENPYYGYDTQVTYDIDLNKPSNYLANTQKRIKLSGYVWLDTNQEKTSVRNDLYDQGVEKGVDGITVYLKNAQGQTLQTTTTKELGLYNEIDGGEYQFVDVNLDELENYYIEYQYCGITYQSVAKNLNKQNGSKAIDDSTRAVLDSKFSSVDGNGTQQLNVNGVEVDYNDVSEYKSTVAGHKGCDVYARTNEAGYNLLQDFEPTMEEIRYINLGLFEKAQTDYALTKDLHNVRIEVNGREHVYKYATSRYTADDELQDDIFNVDVRFQKNNGKFGSYQRPIYESDAYSSKGDSNKLQIYLTYKIAVKNESTYSGRINSILDYSDPRVTLQGVGTSIGETDYKVAVDGNIKFTSDGTVNGYTKNVININSELDAEETEFYYLEFKVNDQGVLALISDDNTGKNILVNNIAEINSYTTFKDGTKDPLAVIDTDSVPGNAKPGLEKEQIDTFEDDTDAAPTLDLQLKNARKIEGTVFVDNDTEGKDEDTVYTNKERKGDGIYDTSKEQPVKTKDVEVKLVNLETGSTAKLYNQKDEETDAVTKTDENGNFSFQGFLPGRYEVVYTWGNKTYRVQYYKGTIYDQRRTAITGTNNGSLVGSNENVKDFWYRGSETGNDIISKDTRANDAIDNFNTRKAIDAQLTNYDSDPDAGKNTLEERINASYDNKDGKFITKMDSHTPAIEISVEYPTTITDGTKDEVVYTLAKVDFGIIKRPLQQLDIAKRVSGYKITLANGQVLVDAKIKEIVKADGTKEYQVEGTKENTVFPRLGPNGLIKTEMDSELIEGATMQVVYTISATNTSEKDYTSEKYYKYGDSTGAELVKISPSQILDYVDGRLSVTEGSTDWKIADENYATNYNVSKKDDKTYLNSVKSYITKKLASEYLEPTKSASVDLETSKLLTTTEDNEFNNKVETTEAKKNKGDSTGSPVIVRTDIKAFNISDAETIEILPSTGGNKEYVLPIIIGIAVIAILGIGIFLIKMLVVDDKKTE